MQVLFIVALIHITVEWSFVEYFFNRAGPEGFLYPVGTMVSGYKPARWLQGLAL